MSAVLVSVVEMLLCMKCVYICVWNMVNNYEPHRTVVDTLALATVLESRTATDNCVGDAG
jgi:hypothetical protein